MKQRNRFPSIEYELENISSPKMKTSTQEAHSFLRANDFIIDDEARLFKQIASIKNKREPTQASNNDHKRKYHLMPANLSKDSIQNYEDAKNSFLELCPMKNSSNIFFESKDSDSKWNDVFATLIKKESSGRHNTDSREPPSYDNPAVTIEHVDFSAENRPHVLNHVKLTQDENALAAPVIKYKPKKIILKTRNKKFNKRNTVSLRKDIIYNQILKDACTLKESINESKKFYSSLKDSGTSKFKAFSRKKKRQSSTSLLERTYSKVSQRKSVLLQSQEVKENKFILPFRKRMSSMVYSSNTSSALRLRKQALNISGIGRNSQVNPPLLNVAQLSHIKEGSDLENSYRKSGSMSVSDSVSIESGKPKPSRPSSKLRKGVKTRPQQTLQIARLSKISQKSKRVKPLFSSYSKTRAKRDPGADRKEVLRRVWFLIFLLKNHKYILYKKWKKSPTPVIQASLTKIDQLLTKLAKDDKSLKNDQKFILKFSAEYFRGFKSIHGIKFDSYITMLLEAQNNRNYLKVSKFEISYLSSLGKPRKKRLSKCRNQLNFIDAWRLHKKSASRNARVHSSCHGHQPKLVNIKKTIHLYSPNTSCQF
ncbi:unnamed protein product [Moneuplotes crassus]|uniref:Uncharacterized protein n=1 Tax=Euplotes crassus TaxID=5936 RepID=A0AAD1X640_EUPCR|nr:unnamed protein product [Moneuplotes crassus]